MVRILLAKSDCSASLKASVKCMVCFQITEVRLQITVTDDGIPDVRFLVAEISGGYWIGRLARRSGFAQAE